MSLVGNLEDLGLGEILQIVSLSRKSGVLSLYSKGKEGKIVFRHGQVISAVIDGVQPPLGKLLVKKGIVDKTTLSRALTLQAEGGKRERLGDILTGRFSVQADAIEEVVREHVEKVVYTLFTWEEGSFDFELSDGTDDFAGSDAEPDQYQLQQGVNPQFLAMEGSRILDENRHRGEFSQVEELEGDDNDLLDTCDLAFDLMQDQSDERGAVTPAKSSERLVVLVDDDDAVRARLVTLLGGWGYAVHDFAKTEDTLIKIDFLYRDGHRPQVVVDLIMPRMDGSGILGGIELVDLIYDNFPDLAVIVLADHSTNNAEQKIAEKGYPLLLKPRRADIGDEASFQDFSERLRLALAAPVRGELPQAAQFPAVQTVNLGDELCREIGEDFVPLTEPGTSAPGVSLLRSMLGELSSPMHDGDVILLVLRFATEFMNRAVAFLVKDGMLMGFGQFGITVADGCADARVRDLRIPVRGDHLFRRVLDSTMAEKFAPDGAEWNRYFFEKIGGTVPDEVFLGPVVSEGKVVALLYGDNLPDGKAIGDTDSLEIFLSQAGMAMDRVLLQRRLKEKAQEGA